VRVDDQHSKRDLQDVSDVLDRLWDPIGVYEGPQDSQAPPGEYETYAPAVLRQLRGGIRVEALAAYFRTIEETRMGLRPSGMEQRAAEDVIQWFEARGEHA
jgi:hypothetical protein